MGRHTQFLRMKLKNKKGMVVYNKTTGQVNRQKKGEYVKKNQKWVCIECKHVNNQSTNKCHGIGCSLFMVKS